MVLAQVGISLDQRCPAVAKAGGNILFRGPTHAQPTGKGMPQGVPVHILALILNGIRLMVRFLLQSGFLQGRYIHPMVEVLGSMGVPLTWLGKTHLESFHDVNPFKIWYCQLNEN